MMLALTGRLPSLLMRQLLTSAAACPGYAGTVCTLSADTRNNLFDTAGLAEVVGRRPRPASAGFIPGAVDLPGQIKALPVPHRGPVVLTLGVRECPCLVQRCDLTAPVAVVTEQMLSDS
jgi:hypothetical protein